MLTVSVFFVTKIWQLIKFDKSWDSGDPLPPEIQKGEN